MVVDRCDSISNWSIVEDADCTTSVVALWQGRSDVLEQDDQNGAGNTAATESWANSRQSGTIYWHWGADDVDQQHYFRGVEGLQNRITMQIAGSKIKYNDGAWHSIKDPVVNDTWYDLKIHFECGIGAYQGLEPDTYYVYIGDVQYGPYDFSSVAISLSAVKFETANANTGYAGYIDYLYYSWDVVLVYKITGSITQLNKKSGSIAESSAKDGSIIESNKKSGSIA